MTAALAPRLEVPRLDDRKLCTDCHKAKPLDEFRFDWRSQDRDMRAKRCNDCADDAFWSPGRVRWLISHEDCCIALGQWPGSCSYQDEEFREYARQVKYEGRFVSLVEIRATLQQIKDALKTPWDWYCYSIIVERGPAAAAYSGTSHHHHTYQKRLSWSDAARRYTRRTGDYVTAADLRQGAREVAMLGAKALGWRE